MRDSAKSSATSERWREQQERIYTVGFYGGALLLTPLAVLALFSRHISKPLLLAALTLLGVFGVLLFGYLGVLIAVNARQGFRDTRERRAGAKPGLEIEDQDGGLGETIEPVATQRRNSFWTQRRLLAACAIVGIAGSLARLTGWWAS